MYYYTDDFDSDRFFYFSKEWVESCAWASMPKATKATIPVICSHCDSDGVSFPSQKRVAILSGLSVKQAADGIRSLKSFEHVDITKRESRGGRIGNAYTVRRTKRGFPIYSSIFHGGLWFMASSAAKCLYIVLRCYGGLGGDLLFVYCDIEGLEEDDREEIYKKRKWEVCDSTESFLCEKAGIHRNSFMAAMESLIEVGLVLPEPEKYHIDGYRVVVKPSISYKREYLNSIVKNRYQKC